MHRRQNDCKQISSSHQAPHTSSLSMIRSGSAMYKEQWTVLRSLGLAKRRDDELRVEELGMKLRLFRGGSRAWSGERFSNSVLRRWICTFHDDSLSMLFQRSSLGNRIRTFRITIDQGSHLGSTLCQMQLPRRRSWRHRDKQAKSNWRWTLFRNIVCWWVSGAYNP